MNVRFRPVALKHGQHPTFMPLPNAAGQVDRHRRHPQHYIDSRSAKNDTDQVTTRIDHQFTPQDTLFGRFSFQDSRQYSPNIFPGFGAVSNVRTSASASITPECSRRV